MGQLFFTGHCCLFVPSLGQNQQPPADDYFRIRGMEEGRLPPPDVSPACWNFFKIFWRCFTSTASIALIVWLFVGRHYNLDPDLQAPYMMAVCIVFSLLPAVFGFMVTQGDTCAIPQGVAHL